MGRGAAQDSPHQASLIFSERELVGKYTCLPAGRKIFCTYLRQLCVGEASLVSLQDEALVRELARRIHGTLLDRALKAQAMAEMAMQRARRRAEMNQRYLNETVIVERAMEGVYEVGVP